MKELINKLLFEKTKDARLQFLRYVFVGGIAAVTNIGLLYICTDLLKVYYLISNVIGFMGGLSVNYLLSKKLVFAAEEQINKTLEFTIYAAIGVVGLGLDTLLMWIFTSKMGIYYLISKIISTGLVFIWNFGARKVLYIILEKISNLKKNMSSSN